jgi:hypothetical protein
VSSCYGFIEAEKTSFPSSSYAARLGFRGAANTSVVKGLREVGMTLSMGKTGTALDNAMAEVVCLKTEG